MHVFVSLVAEEQDVTQMQLPRVKAKGILAAFIKPGVVAVFVG